MSGGAGGSCCCSAGDGDLVEEKIVVVKLVWYGKTTAAWLVVGGTLGVGCLNRGDGSLVWEMVGVLQQNGGAVVCWSRNGDEEQCACGGDGDAENPYGSFVPSFLLLLVWFGRIWLLLLVDVKFDNPFRGGLEMREMRLFWSRQAFGVRVTPF